ncbi:MAG: hypothetical protein CL573_08965 [Alphaproteobacteria bacterium]|nr:hypothetical protein [Alphaproteobacteria bacterium]
MRFWDTSIAVSLLVSMACAQAHAQAIPRDVYLIDMAAVECFEVIGKAPEHREIMRRRGGEDLGPAKTFIVRIRDTIAEDIRATYSDVEDSPHPGFEHFRSSAIRFDFGGDDPGSMTQILPRDRFIMFSMSEGVIAELARERPRCGARHRFDRKPFEALYWRVRDTLRQMLDQGAR